ncbi:MAG: DHCW motif cupin fold protein [Chitinophagaceae bacterium]|nr:DHCW motif cupin fold protein [Chitinophagaceae bacterium]
MYNIPFQTIDWSQIEKTEHRGITGVAYWQTILLDGLRIRIVEYSAGYFADHWCQKGHIVYCLDGEVINENEDGHEVTLTPGISYIVSDGLSSHRSKTSKGARLLIIDGHFLNPSSGLGTAPV